MKKFCKMGAYLVLLCQYALFAFAVLPDEGDPRYTESLNGTWRFQKQQIVNPPLPFSFDEIEITDSWESIPVPSHWELTGYPEQQIGLPFISVGTYQRNISIPSGWRGRRIFLHFAGVLGDLRILIDGHAVGVSLNTAGAIQFEITQSLEQNQEHDLMVQVARDHSGSEDEQTLSGIFREVILFSTSPLCLDSLSTSSQIRSQGESAALNVTLQLLRLDADIQFEGTILHLNLLSPLGESVAQLEVTYLEIQGDRATARASLSVHKPDLWNAENPALYTLMIELRSEGRTQQRIHRRIGFREITFLRNSLYLNGSPLTIRGVDYAQKTPDAGYALDEKQLLADLSLMKEANINTIRSIEVLPSQKFLQICDEMGFYVLSDIPAVPSVLADTTASIVQETSSIHFDISDLQPYPSILGWSLLSITNPYQAQALAESLQKINPRRPLIARADQSISADMHVLVRPVLSELLSIAKYDRPVIFTSIPARFHLGLYMQQIQKIPNLIGGTVSPWSRSSLKSRGELLGTGRRLNLEYWQTRKVYSPVRIEESQQRLRKGRQVIELNLYNEFDFTNLSGVSCKWQLQRDALIVQESDLILNLAPHQRMKLAFPLDIPADYLQHDYHLKLYFKRGGRVFYEHSVWLQSDAWERNLILRLKDLEFDPVMRVTSDVYNTQIQQRTFTMNTRSATAEWFLHTNERNVRMITEGPFIEFLQGNGEPQNGEPIYKDLWIDKRHVQKQGKNIEIQSEFYAIAPKSKEPLFRGFINLLASSYGYLDVLFRVRPKRNEIVRQAGISFLVPPQFNRITWVGLGPYPSSPGMEELAIRGIYQIDLREEWYPGNRSQVSHLALTDDRGNGLGMILLGGDVDFQPAVQGGTNIKVHAVVAGSHPDVVPLASGSEIIAVFRLLPWEQGRMPGLFRDLLDLK